MEYWEIKEKYKDLKMEDVEAALSGIYKAHEEDGTDCYVKQLDNGIWEIKVGKNRMWTNEQGVRAFDKAVKEAIEEEIKKSVK